MNTMQGRMTTVQEALRSLADLFDQHPDQRPRYPHVLLGPFTEDDLGIAFTPQEDGSYAITIGTGEQLAAKAGARLRTILERNGITAPLP